MRQILFTNEKGTFDLSTSEGKEQAFGKAQGTPMIVTDESGEIICAYNHPSEIEKNTLLIKTIREKFPNQTLRKGIDLYQEELMLKAEQEKSEMMLKSKPIVSRPRGSSEQIERTFAKLDKLLMTHF